MTDNTVAALVTVVNKKDQLVGQTVEGTSVEAVNRKLDKLRDAGTLVEVRGWYGDNA